MVVADWYHVTYDLKCGYVQGLMHECQLVFVEGNTMRPLGMSKCYWVSTQSLLQTLGYLVNLKHDMLYRGVERGVTAAMKGRRPIHKNYTTSSGYM